MDDSVKLKTTPLQLHSFVTFSQDICPAQSGTNETSIWLNLKWKLALLTSTAAKKKTLKCQPVVGSLWEPLV